MTEFWYEDLPEGYSWESLWYGYIICGQCGGIRKTEGLCPVCHKELPGHRFTVIKNQDGNEIELPVAYMGAEGRYEDYVYLQMLEQEWRRPITEFGKFNLLSREKRPAPKAVIVLVFWIYFETRIERLLTGAMRNLPGSISQNLLKRYPQISSRTSELYKILFGNASSYHADLEKSGFHQVAELLNRVQLKRNQFMHGFPEAIDEQLIVDIVKSLKTEHEGWISVFNARVAHAPQ